MTDEFFVAVTEFNLSWNEIKLLTRNSIKYAFLESKLKSQLLENYEMKVTEYENMMKDEGISNLGSMPVTKGFICRNYNICN